MNNRTKLSVESRTRTWLKVGAASLLCQRLINNKLLELDLTFAQHFLLSSVESLQPVTQAELATYLYAVKSNVSSLIKKMEAKGYISRETGESDRRSNKVSLTASGKRILTKSKIIELEVMKLMTDEISAEEMETLDRVMNRVTEALLKP